MKRHYEIEGVLYPSSDWANWAYIDRYGVLMETADKWDANLTPATTELDRFCLKHYGSMFDKIDTNTQRILENLHKKGGLVV